MNLTDPDTRMMNRVGGNAVQGDNVQVVASPKQIILAARVAQTVNDSNQLEPMVTHATAELVRAGIEDPTGTVLADGGYWNTPQIGDVRGRQIDVLIPSKHRKRSKPRTLGPPQSDEADRIEAILDTSEGQALSRRRQQIVDPVLANTKSLRRIDRSRRRGIRACRAESKLIAATHNLLKLWRAGNAPAAA